MSHAPSSASAFSWELVWVGALRDQTHCQEAPRYTNSESQVETVALDLPFYVSYDDARLGFVKFIPALNHLSEFCSRPRYIKSPRTP